ncbi:MAG: alkaline phosphatase family protein [Rhodothermales bacterium]
MRYWYLGILMVISLVSFCLRQPLTVVVMIDGFPVRYLEDYHTPNLNGLGGAGVQAKAIQSVLPVKTASNPYTIVTGLYPDHHGAISKFPCRMEMGPACLYAPMSRQAENRLVFIQIQSAQSQWV